VDLITLDFETYYDKDFSLKKLTTEEYIRDPRFEIIGLGIKVNNDSTEWASGTFEDFKGYIHSFDWENSMVLAHNTMFDGAILSWLFGVKPKVWADTLCMGRAVHGIEVSGSLKAMAERYEIGVKGTEVLNALGKRREDFDDEALSLYGDYCVNDVELTHSLFNIMADKFPKKELKIIDTTLRMFIEPVLDLDTPLLEEHLINIRDRKDELLINAGIEDKKDLMSNDKFAGLLRDNNVSPPMKISPTTGKETYAFAKTDEGFKQLQEHWNQDVQNLVAARLGNKSTLEETRTQRFIDIAKRGNLPIPLRYYAAHTGRWGGSDKINLQNLPSRGENGGVLKKSVLAPDGHVLIDCDSSQIEARVLAWWAGQKDLVDAFHNKEDVYVNMASRIYRCDRASVTKDQRFVGKTTILGAGYGMGAQKFMNQLNSFGVNVEYKEASRIIQTYRTTNPSIKKLWTDAMELIEQLSKGFCLLIGDVNIVEPIIGIKAVKLPSGLLMRYEDLKLERDEYGAENYTFKTRNGRSKIYGGKFVENVCQAVARCVIGEQMLEIAKRYKVVLTVHDSLVVCVKEEEADEARQYVEDCMRAVPDWAKGLPLDCESGVGKSYGGCE
jgi:DNA polymerase|tara:strand:- start:982 stop:2814 length:1833 start_codon:yes stop_codon:yes gene_type:complete